MITPWKREFDTGPLEWIVIYWFRTGKKIKRSDWLKRHLKKISEEENEKD